MRQAQQGALAADAELRVVMIDEFAQFTGVRASEFFEPLQLHLQPPDLLEQFSLLGLTLLVVLTMLVVLALLAKGQQLTGTIKRLALPLAHLDRVDGVIGCNLLDRLAATDRLYDDHVLELVAMGAARAHGWEPLSGAVLRLNG